jgi:ribosomal protein S27AE
MGHFKKGEWIESTTRAPFQEGQVDSINAYQCSRSFHPFTCPKCGGVLVASTHGMDCYDCGKWFQAWVHDFMANWKWQSLDQTSTEK